MSRKLSVLLLATACGSFGAVIQISNTGLAAEGSVDPNWTVNGAPAFVAVSDGFPIGIWRPNDGTSAWIMPIAGDFDTHPENTTYTYGTTFTLNGLDPATAELSYQALVDNEITDVLLNGVSTGNISILGAAAFTATYRIASGFRSGLNVLEFVTQNRGGTTGNPAGLRVEITGTAAATPEPSTLFLLGAGLAGLAIVRRRA